MPGDQRPFSPPSAARPRADARRDPGEGHRAATPLELLYDLTLVVAFSVAGSQFAHALAGDHIGSGLLSFLFCMFAIVWAWQAYTWFASAYDTDDWAFRIATLAQMLGVTILALGITNLFREMEEGRLDYRAIVIGYVIMRLSMISLWVRAARNDPEHRGALLANVVVIGAAQIGWIFTAFADLPTGFLLGLMAMLYLIEVGGTWLITVRYGAFPWHPHHIAERYGLLAIITFGEVVLGTTTAVEAVKVENGWTLDAAVLAVAGITMVVGMWWVYFAVPNGEVLRHRRRYGVRWAYAHVVIYSTITATGAGLHAVAYSIEHHSELGPTATAVTVAVPLGLYLVALFTMFHLILPGRDPFHRTLLGLTAATIAGAVALAATGVSIAWPILVLTAAPWITAVGFEVRGHRHIADRLSEL
ncbi:MAG: low temperature requirement protein A [Acidimicrobiales bacterium]